MAKNKVIAITAITMFGKAGISILRLDGRMRRYPIPANPRLQLVLEHAMEGASISLLPNEVSAFKYFDEEV